MPEFHIDIGDKHDDWNDLDSFTQGYIEAAFFTCTGPDDEENGLGEGSFSELAASTVEQIKTDCARFQLENIALIEAAIEHGGHSQQWPYDLARAGNDFWYSRNRHGVGYWDRGFGDLGDKLHAATKAYRELYMVRGDDQLIYVE